MARTSGIEPLSWRGQRKALPIYQVRIFKMVGNRGIEPRTRKGAGFTGPLSLQTWRYPECCKGRRRAEGLTQTVPPPEPPDQEDVGIARGGRPGGNWLRRGGFEP